MDQESKQPAPISSETIPVNQIPPSPKSKIPLVLLLIFLLFLFGFGGILVGRYLRVSQSIPPIPTLGLKPTAVPTTTSDATASWKTYINKKHGYLIKIPNNWGEWSANTGEWKFNININEMGDTILLGLNQPVLKDKEGIITPPQKVDILFFKMSLAQLDKISDTTHDEECLKDENLNINNSVSVIKRVCSYEGQGTIKQYFIRMDKDKNILKISSSSNTTELDQILSTFKFVD